MNSSSFKVRILNGFEGASRAGGAVVVIDVFRAFSLASLAVDRGAKAIYPVAEIESALALGKQLDDSILVGERHGKKLDGFDYGNSPTEISNADIKDKIIVHTTHAGTRGLWTVADNRHPVSHLFAASFVNAKATVQAVLATRSPTITIVPLGWAGEKPTVEDSLCAHYLAAHFTRPQDAPTWTSEDLENRLKKATSSQRFFDPDQPWAPESDFYRCCDVDSTSNALLME